MECFIPEVSPTRDLLTTKTTKKFKNVTLGLMISKLSIHAGNQADFDHWAQLGNYGWSYADVLPFFKKAEDNRIRGLERGYSMHYGPKNNFSCHWYELNFILYYMRTTNSVFLQTIYDIVQPLFNNYFSFHGKGGPMPVELIKTRTPSASLFVEACKHVGFKFRRDYNGVNQFGVTFQHQNSKDGSKFSTARGYLKPVHRRRPNLTILLGCL